MFSELGTTPIRHSAAPIADQLAEIVHHRGPRRADRPGMLTRLERWLEHGAARDRRASREKSGI